MSVGVGRKPLLALATSLLAVLTPVLLVEAAVPAAASSTSTAGACTDRVGVTVVVDFQELGGGVVVRCLTHPTSATTGLDALKGTGFVVTGTLHDGPGYVCRINGEPTVDVQPCISTPPATAYWSYWYAPNGGSWTYSSSGAASRRVVPGGFEGWSFAQDKGAGSIPPPRLRPSHPVVTSSPSPTSTTRPTARPTSRPTPAAGIPGSPTSTAGATSPGAVRSPSATGSASPSAPDSGSLTASAVAVGGAAGPPASGAGHGAGGSPLGSLLGGGLVLAALGGAGLVAVRRRSDPTIDG